MSDMPAIKADGLVKHYGKTKALNGLDLTVPTRAPSTGCSARTGRGRPPPSGCWPRCCARTAARRASSAATWSPRPPPSAGRIGLTGQYAALDEYLTGRANLS